MKFRLSLGFHIFVDLERSRGAENWIEQDVIVEQKAAMRNGYKPKWVDQCLNPSASAFSHGTGMTCCTPIGGDGSQKSRTRTTSSHQTSYNLIRKIRS